MNHSIPQRLGYANKLPNILVIDSILYRPEYLYQSQEKTEIHTDNQIPYYFPIEYTTNALPSSSLLYDNFESGIYSLKDGQTSPNTMWQNIYNGGGLSGVTYEGISNNKVFFLYPAIAKSVNETYSNLVMSTKNFSDFELSADVKTVGQLRQNSHPNAWEAATIFFRWTDTFRYYWFTIKVNGIELGKKDCYTCTDTKQGQQFLFTAPTPVLKIGSWSNWNIKTHDNHITISVNGSKVIDLVDEKMSTNLDTGKIAMYVEDASAYFDNIYITPK